MRKKKNTPNLFYAQPSRDPAFSELQKTWYALLKKKGFEDAESVDHEDRPLKRWSGISSIYVEKFQPAGLKLISSFPESVYREEEQFQNHPEFSTLCIRICGHGNSRLTPEKVRLIWFDYCDGQTIRQSEIKYRISDTTVFRVIRTITEWMKLMDTRPIQEPTGTAVIVLRAFDPEMDPPIIYSSWRNALWFSEPRDERLAGEFYSFATKEIKKLLADPSISVRIACDKEEPSFIAGYAVMRGDNVEFTYVKIEYRKKGIARLLTRGFKTISQPQTKIGKAIAEKNKLVVKENYGKEETGN